MTLRIFQIVIVLIISWSCNTKDSDSLLTDDSTIEMYFSKGEISELDELVNKFDSVISNRTSHSENIYEAYEQYFNDLTNVNSPNEHIPLYFLNNLEIQDLISHSTFKKIWSITMRYNRKGELIGSYIDVEPGSSYFKYLKRVFNENIKIAEYINYLSRSGTILSPGDVNVFFHNFKNVKFSDKRNRLIIAIQIITLNYYYSERYAAHKMPNLEKWFNQE